MSKTLKIGFIGAGGIARWQAELLKKVQGAEVVAAADVSEGALDQFKKQIPTVTETYRDWKQLLARKDIEAVSVCTPNKMHCEPTIAALKAGKLS